MSRNSTNIYPQFEKTLAEIGSSSRFGRKKRRRSAADRSKSPPGRQYGALKFLSWSKIDLKWNNYVFWSGARDDHSSKIYPPPLKSILSMLQMILSRTILYFFLYKIFSNICIFLSFRNSGFGSLNPSQAAIPPQKWIASQNRYFRCFR